MISEHKLRRFLTDRIALIDEFMDTTREYDDVDIMNRYKWRKATFELILQKLDSGEFGKTKQQKTALEAGADVLK